MHALGYRSRYSQHVRILFFQVDVKRNAILDRDHLQHVRIYSFSR